MNYSHSDGPDARSRADRELPKDATEGRRDRDAPKAAGQKDRSASVRNPARNEFLESGDLLSRVTQQNRNDRRH